MRGAVLLMLVASAACGRFRFDEVPVDAADATTSDAPGQPLALTTVTAGGRHACGLDPSGVAYCWGGNETGQLGIGSFSEPVPFATRIGDGTQTWKAIAAGGDHTCALTTAGTAWCWGTNVDGEVTGVAGGMQNTPVEVSINGVPPAFETIAAGGYHTCAIGNGELWCWGYGPYNGTGGNPAGGRVSLLSDVVAVALSDNHGCRLSSSQGVSCWGHNGQSQTLGMAGADTTVPVAVTIPATGGRVPIAIGVGGQLSCAIMATGGASVGELWCWGGEAYSILDGSLVSFPPTRIGTDTEWSSVSPGSFRVCGILRGVRRCWGDQFAGDLGDGVLGGHLLPGQSPMLEAVDQVVLNSISTTSGMRAAYFGCIRQGMQVSCFGDGYSGETGQGFMPFSATPKRVAPPSGTKWTNIVAEGARACGVTDDAAAWCWGANSRGEVTGTPGLGWQGTPCVPGALCDVAVPIRAPAAVGTPDEFALTTYFSCARTGTTVQCWDGGGVVNKGTWDTLSGSLWAACGITAGLASCWGRLLTGYSTAPTLLPGVENNNLVAVATGEDNACTTRSSDNARVCWGTNSRNELGNGTTNSVAVPVAYDIGAISRVSMGPYDGGCALTTAGGVLCWGINLERRAGQPVNYAAIPNPAAVSDASGPLAACTEVVVGFDHACAICSGRGLCWGRNGHAELGQGTVSDPRDVAAELAVPASSTIVKIAASNGGGLALDSQGQLFCWGAAHRGECADGLAAVPYPMPVLTR